MKKLFVYDIDGTVADIEHRRHWVMTKPKNWNAFFAAQHLDKPHEDIIWTLKEYHKAGHKIVFATGRGEEYRDVTIKWLAEQGVPYDNLYMRDIRDSRHDYIVKIEMMKRIQAVEGEIFMWFDDRNQVVNALRKEGIRVLQVNPGDF